MEFQIRNAVPEDCQRIRPLQKEIAQLHHEGRPDLFKTEARYFSEEDFLHRLQNENHTVLIAEGKDGQVVGYAFAWVKRIRSHSTYVDFDCFYIDDICVLKAYQGRGIGRQLFTCCKEKAKTLKCKNIDLSVYDFNSSAIAFYNACGMQAYIHRMELKLEGTE